MYLFAVFVMFAPKYLYGEAANHYTPAGYIGCYQDGSIRVLPLLLNNTYGNTGDYCKARCRSRGYKYAGTEVGVQCFCGDRLQSNVTGSKCNYQCPGNRLEQCGGYWELSVYETWRDLVTIEPGTSTVGEPSEFTSRSHAMAAYTTTKILSAISSHAKATKKATVAQTDVPLSLKFSTNNGHATDSIASLTLDQRNPTESQWHHGVPLSSRNLNYYISHTAMSAIGRNRTTSPPNQIASVSDTNMTSRTDDSSTTNAPEVPSLGSPIFTTHATNQSSASNHHMTWVTAKHFLRDLGNNMTKKSWQPTGFFDKDWTAVGNDQFFVNYRTMAYFDAQDYCQILNASLVEYIKPLKYLNLSSAIVLKRESYWIGGCGSTNSSNCMVLTTVNQEADLIHLSHVKDTRPSICSRISNITLVLSDPKFIEMLQNMTVNKERTKKAERKNTSADDKRTTSKIVGEGIGIISICVFAAFLLLMDVDISKKCL